MKFSVRLGRVLATVIAALALTSTFEGAATAAPVDVSEDLLTPGTLLVGSDIPYRPFEFHTKNGVAGFDIDVVKAMAKKLELKVVFKDTYFDTIFTDVKNRKFDLVASAATITPDRRRHVSFSKPYYDAVQSLVVRRGSHIRSVRDLSGATVSAQDGTTGEAYAHDETQASEVLGYPNGQAAIRALKRGRADALIIDQPVIVKAIKRGGSKLRIVKNISVGEKYGFAMSKRTPTLRKGINRALGQIKSDGSFKRIYRKWFGIAPPPSLKR